MCWNAISQTTEVEKTRLDWHTWSIYVGRVLVVLYEHRVHTHTHTHTHTHHSVVDLHCVHDLMQKDTISQVVH